MAITQNYPLKLLSPKSRLIRQVSYSSLNVFRSCERKYQLQKWNIGSWQDSVDTVFGKAVGAGIQALWQYNGDLDKAKLAVFQNWAVPLYDSKDTAKKNFSYALRALERYVPFYEIMSRDWELAYYNGKPCVEFSIRIVFPRNFVFRGYVDLILQHKETGELGTTEVKTTGFNVENEAIWKNQDQGISYSVFVDQIKPDAKHLWVKYHVYHTKSQEWIPYEFTKPLLAKAKWLKTVLRDIEDIERCEREDYWPMRGGSCMDYGTPCRFFDTCQFQDSMIVNSNEALEQKIQLEDNTNYQFEIRIEDIIKGYLG